MSKLKGNFAKLSSPQKPEIDDSISASKNLLNKLSSYWPRRAIVKKEELDFGLFDPTKVDFIEELLPFSDHPTYQQLDSNLKNKILSSAWIAYNEKTIALETAVVNPLCVDIIYNQLPGLNNETCTKTASEIMTDEAYHVLMVVNSTKITRQNRMLYFHLEKLNLVQHMQEEQDKYPEYWQKCIIQFITALVAEIFTSKSMAALSKNTAIQPLHQKTVHAHYIDEAAHGSVFKELAKLFFARLATNEKNFFIRNILKPSQWLADPELNNWNIIFDNINVRNTRELIEDCKQNYALKIRQMDHTNILNLGEELGIKKSSIEALID